MMSLIRTGTYFCRHLRCRDVAGRRKQWEGFHSICYLNPCVEWTSIMESSHTILKACGLLECWRHRCFCNLFCKYSDPSTSCNSWTSAHREIKHLFTLFQMIRQMAYHVLGCLLLMSPFFFFFFERILIVLSYWMAINKNFVLAMLNYDYL